MATHEMGAESVEVVVIGNVGIDTNVYFYDGEPDFERESNFTENLDYIGQAGGYASLGYARLGRRTAFIGHVGDDASGAHIRSTLTEAGIDLRGLAIDPTGTARSINLMYGDGRRKNFYDGKGHMTLSPDLDLCAALFRGARLAHFNLPNWGRKLLPLARAAGVTIACDLQDVVSLCDGYRDDFIDHADIVFFSAANSGDPVPLLRELMANGRCRVAVAGMGAEGCAVATAEGIRRFAAVSGPTPVIDTNGAGDALAVGFLEAFVLRGEPLETAIRCGQVAARHTCGLRANSCDLITAEIMARALLGRD